MVSICEIRAMINLLTNDLITKSCGESSSWLRDGIGRCIPWSLWSFSFRFFPPLPDPSLLLSVPQIQLLLNLFFFFFSQPFPFSFYMSSVGGATHSGVFILPDLCLSSRLEFLAIWYIAPHTCQSQYTLPSCHVLTWCQHPCLPDPWVRKPSWRFNFAFPSTSDHDVLPVLPLRGLLFPFSSLAPVLLCLSTSAFLFLPSPS